MVVRDFILAGPTTGGRETVVEPRLGSEFLVEDSIEGQAEVG